MDKKITQLPAAASVTVDDLIPIVDDPGVTPVTQKATVQQLITLVESLDVDYFNLVGTDYIGGDQTGNARGGMTVDVSSLRANATEVASGNLSSCFGQQNTASGISAQAIGSQNLVTGAGAMGFGLRNNSTDTSASAFGYQNTASSVFSVAMGFSNSASGNTSVAIGSTCDASATISSAMGYGAVARIIGTTNICGPQIIRKDNGEGITAFRSFCGVETVLLTEEVDLKTPGTTTLTLPAGCHFWLDEAFIIDTIHNTVSVQPVLSIGITGTNNKYVSSQQTTLLTAVLKREQFLISGADGETSLTATIVTGSTATAHNGRFGFRGLLIEDE